MIKANGRSALILAAGLVAGLAAPSFVKADELNTPVFVSPATNGAQPNAPIQPAAGNQVVPPDQLNDLDRSLHENTTAQSSPPPGAIDAPAARSVPVMAASGEHSVWNETSLIGKIFIGFGALLTIASAARMFMA